jgi:hypothetical protein
LVESFFAGIAEGMLHHVCHPSAKGRKGSEGVGHGDSARDKTSMVKPRPPANGNLLGLP